MALYRHSHWVMTFIPAVMVIVALEMLIITMIGRADRPSGWNSVSASVSLAGVDFVSGSNLSSSNFTFNVHIELLADSETEYGSATLFLRSRDGTNLDGSEISGARVGHGETRRLDASVRLVSRYRFDGSSLVYSDPVASDGVVKLWTHVMLSKEARATCELSVDLRSRALIYSECMPQ